MQEATRWVINAMPPWLREAGVQHRDVEGVVLAVGVRADVAVRSDDVEVPLVHPELLQRRPERGRCVPRREQNRCGC